MVDAGIPESSPGASPPPKKRRGRPRKSDTVDQTNGTNKKVRPKKPSQLGPPQVDGSLVGQSVHGVLDGSFDAGYILTVRVGDTDTILRGVVFGPGLSVPVTPATDIAPNVRFAGSTARVFRREETPIGSPPAPAIREPPVGSPSPVSREQTGSSSLSFLSPSRFLPGPPLTEAALRAAVGSVGRQETVFGYVPPGETAVEIGQPVFVFARNQGTASTENVTVGMHGTQATASTSMYGVQTPASEQPSCALHLANGSSPQEQAKDVQMESVEPDQQPKA